MKTAMPFGPGRGLGGDCNRGIVAPDLEGQPGAIDGCLPHEVVEGVGHEDGVADDDGPVEEDVGRVRPRGGDQARGAGVDRHLPQTRHARQTGVDPDEQVPLAVAVGVPHDAGVPRLQRPRTRLEGRDPGGRSRGSNWVPSLATSTMSPRESERDVLVVVVVDPDAFGHLEGGRVEGGHPGHDQPMGAGVEGDDEQRDEDDEGKVATRAGLGHEGRSPARNGA